METKPKKERVRKVDNSKRRIRSKTERKGSGLFSREANRGEFERDRRSERSGTQTQNSQQERLPATIWGVKDLPSEKFPYSNRLLAELYRRWMRAYRADLDHGHRCILSRFEHSMFKRYKLWYKASIGKFIYEGPEPKNFKGRLNWLFEMDRQQSPPLSRVPLFRVKRKFLPWQNSVADIKAKYPYQQEVLDELAYRWHRSDLADRRNPRGRNLEKFETRMYERFKLLYDCAERVFEYYGNPFGIVIMH